MSDFDDIDLAGLTNEDLIAQMHDDLYDGLGEEIVEGTTILLDRGWGPDKVLQQALVEGMRIVGVTSVMEFCSCQKCFLPRTQ